MRRRGGMVTKLALQHPVQAARAVPVNVTALQLAVAFSRIEGSAAVQHTVVVKYHQLTGFELEA